MSAADAPLASLRERYPWPETCPKVAPKNHGWFSGKDIFPRWAGPQVKVVVELGSWLGLSAKWFVNNCPNAAVICVDHWEGSREHHKNPNYAQFLPTLYDTFLVNMWQWRDRIIPVRSTSVEGLKEIHSLGVKPDLVYIDAAHEREPVYQDTKTAIECFPDAQIFGDDWPMPPLQEGVRQALAEHGLSHRLKHQGRIWWIAKEQG